MWTVKLALYAAAVWLALGAAIAADADDTRGARPFNQYLKLDMGTPSQSSLLSRERPVRPGIFVYVCKDIAFRGRQCGECDSDIASLDVSRFRLGMVLSVSARGSETGNGRKMKVITCRRSFVKGQSEPGADGMLTCDTVTLRNSNDGAVCVKRLSYRDYFPRHSGKRGFALVLERARRDVFEADGKGEVSAAGELFVKQMVHDMHALTGQYETIRDEHLLAVERKRLSEYHRALTQYKVVSRQHERVSRVVSSMVVDIKEKMAELGLDDVRAAQTMCGGVDANRMVVDIRNEGLELREARKTEKWQQYTGLIKGMGLMTLLLVEVGADMGIPGLGTVLQWGELAVELTIDNLSQAVEAIGGHEGLMAILENVMEVRDAINDAISDAGLDLEARVLELVEDEDWQGVVAEGLGAARGELEAGVEELIKGSDDEENGEVNPEQMTADGTAPARNQPKIVHDWQQIVTMVTKATMRVGSDAGKSALVEGTVEASFAAAKLIPFIGAYVGILRHSGLLFKDMRQARQSFSEYQNSKDTLYHSVFGMRDCNLAIVSAYENMRSGSDTHRSTEDAAGAASPEVEVAHARLRSRRRRHKKEIDQDIRREEALEGMQHQARTELKQAHLLELLGTMDSATAAMQANFHLREKLSHQYRIQDMFTFGSKTQAHERRVVTRLESKFGVSRVKPDEWAYNFAPIIVKACKELESIYLGEGLVLPLCCAETCIETYV